jgi:hypothetical protein
MEKTRELYHKYIRLLLRLSLSICSHLLAVYLTESQKQNLCTPQTKLNTKENNGFNSYAQNTTTL